MPPLSRLWFVLPPELGEPVGTTLQALARRPLVALLHAPDDASERLALLLAAQGAPRPTAFSEPELTALDRLAAAHPDLEIAVVGGAGLLLAALARALGLPAEGASRVQPRAGSLHAFHWPTGQDPQAKAELIGLDLDWFPPWHSGQPRPRFPGGPGVAGSARR